MPESTEEAGGDTAKPNGYVFAVGEKPYCCWEWDLPERNLQFLESLDTGYYGYVSDLCIAELETDSKLSASIVLRGAYHQAVETLISLLGAYAQAPEAVPAWLTKAKTKDLEEVACSFLNGGSLLTQTGRQRVTLDMLSRDVHRYCWQDEDGPDSTAARFGRFWQLTCSDLLDSDLRAEYNAIKHGLRIGPGGFTLSIGVEETPGVLSSNMRTMGGSVYGSSFLRSEKVGESSHHIRVRRASLNWSAETMAQRLVLISMSINNIIGSLRCGLGVDPGTVLFLRPDRLDALKDVHNASVGVTSSNFDTVVRIDIEDQWSKEQLIEELERRGNADPEES